MSSDRAIEVRDLGKAYQIYARPQDRLKQMMMSGVRRAVGMPARAYFTEHWALRGVSFEVERGETVAIVGRNGSGKSTLLQIICGTLAPTSGSVQTRGRIGALLELGAGFNPEFTGRENALLNARILGLSPTEAADRIHDIEAFADVGEFFDRPVKLYSSGMYVRVAFAVQACIDPELLIVDEALSVGDEKFQRKCFARLEKLRDSGTSILLVTHSSTMVERFCQRAVLLDKGELVGFGRSNEIVDQYHAMLYADQETYLRLSRQTRTAELAPRYEERDSPDQSPASAPESDARKDGTTAVREIHSRATIRDVRLLNAAGDEAELFRPGATARVAVVVRCDDHIDELQFGISIKTVEGVHAFGTSTLYDKSNVMNVGSGDILTTEFELGLALCEGVYFVSVAIAEAISNSEMSYLDKRTDTIAFRVTEPRVTASGIAKLPHRITVKKE
jgi:lipopolysaccharide transport system ATP-binding protein